MALCPRDRSDKTGNTNRTIDIGDERSSVAMDDVAPPTRVSFASACCISYMPHFTPNWRHRSIAPDHEYAIRRYFHLPLPGKCSRMKCVCKKYRSRAAKDPRCHEGTRGRRETRFPWQKQVHRVVHSRQECFPRPQVPCSWPMKLVLDALQLTRGTDSRLCSSLLGQ